MTTFSETIVARALGLTRGDAREFRQLHLAFGDWKKKRGEVLLTLDAIDRFARFYNLKTPTIDELEKFATEGSSNNGEQPPEKKIWHGRIVPPKPLNPRLVFVEDENGERYVVEVGRNATFCFDDHIEFVPHETQTGIWSCLSPIPRDTRRVRQ